MPMDKSRLRTQKITFWWRWWDEAEHKSTPEKRLAFYDALMRYIFKGEVPVDPCDKEGADGVDYAAYDATHYFDVIDSLVEHGDARSRGGQPGNRNAAKKRISNESENESENESGQKNDKKNVGKKRIKRKNQNESMRGYSQDSKNNNENGEDSEICETNMDEKTNPLRMKNEEGRMKNEECTLRAREVPEVPIETVLMVARAHGIPEDFAREFHADMARQGWQYQAKTREGTRMASVNPGNLAFVMGSFFNFRRRMGDGNDRPAGRKTRGSAASQPEGVILHEEGYENPL